MPPGPCGAGMVPPLAKCDGPEGPVCDHRILTAYLGSTSLSKGLGKLLRQQYSLFGHS